MSVCRALKKLVAGTPVSLAPAYILAGMPTSIQPVAAPPPIEARLFAAETEFMTALAGDGRSPRLTPAEEQTAKSFAVDHPHEFIDVLANSSGQPWADRAARAAVRIAGGDLSGPEAAQPVPAFRTRCRALKLVATMTDDPLIRQAAAATAIIMIRQAGEPLKDGERLALLQTAAHCGTGKSEFVLQAGEWACRHGLEGTLKPNTARQFLCLGLSATRPTDDSHILARRRLQEIRDGKNSLKPV